MSAAFIGGLFVGALLGVLVMALAAISRDDREDEVTIEGLKGTCSHGVKWHHVCEACFEEEAGRAR